MIGWDDNDQWLGPPAWQEELIEAQSATIRRLRNTVKVRDKRIEGLLKRWDDAASDGLLNYYKLKVDKLVKRVAYLEQNYSPRGYGVGQ